MKPPAGLGRDGRRAWRFASATLERLAEDPAASAQAVERYCVLADQLAHACEQWEAQGRPLTALGSAKQEAPHPLLRVQAELRSQMLDLEAALGLNVGARASLARRQGGRGVGRAPDRRPAPSRGGSVVKLAEVVGDARGRAGA